MGICHSFYPGFHDHDHYGYFPELAGGKRESGIQYQEWIVYIVFCRIILVQFRIAGLFNKPLDIQGLIYYILQVLDGEQSMYIR